jgi:hypothetical protein
LPSFDPPARVTQSPTLSKSNVVVEAAYFFLREAVFFFAVVFLAVFFVADFVFGFAFFAMLPS